MPDDHTQGVKEVRPLKLGFWASLALFVVTVGIALTRQSAWSFSGYLALSLIIGMICLFFYNSWKLKILELYHRDWNQYWMEKRNESKR